MKTITLQVTEPERLAIVGALASYQATCLNSARRLQFLGCVLSADFLQAEAVTAHNLRCQFEGAR